jgi:hypothetical protein
MTGIGSTFRVAGLGDLLWHRGLFVNWKESMVKIMTDALVEASAGITDSADDVVAWKSCVIAVSSLTAGPISISLDSEISEVAVNFAFLRGLMSNSPTEVTAKVDNDAYEGGELDSVFDGVLPSTDIKVGNVEFKSKEDEEEGRVGIGLWDKPVEDEVFVGCHSRMKGLLEGESAPLEKGRLISWVVVGWDKESSE